MSLSKQNFKKLTGILSYMDDEELNNLKQRLQNDQDIDNEPIESIIKNTQDGKNQVLFVLNRYNELANSATSESEENNSLSKKNFSPVEIKKEGQLNDILETTTEEPLPKNNKLGDFLNTSVKDRDNSDDLSSTTSDVAVDTKEVSETSVNEESLPTAVSTTSDVAVDTKKVSETSVNEESLPTAVSTTSDVAVDAKLPSETSVNEESLPTAVSTTSDVAVDDKLPSETSVNEETLPAVVSTTSDESVDSPANDNSKDSKSVVKVKNLDVLNSESSSEKENLNSSEESTDDEKLDLINKEINKIIKNNSTKLPESLNDFLITETPTVDKKENETKLPMKDTETVEKESPESEEKKIEQAEQSLREDTETLLGLLRNVAEDKDLY